jgi:flagellar hook assembly protein FlgD
MAVSDEGWTVEILDGPSSGYMNPGETKDVTVRVYVPSGAANFDTDDLTFTATSVMDASVSESGIVTTTVIITAADDPNDPIVPGVFALKQNYPNPFNPTTTIEFSLEKAMHIELTVYNVIGQKVRTLANQYLSIGNHVLEWDGTDEEGRTVSSGIYFYRLTTDDYARTRKMVLTK